MNICVFFADCLTPKMKTLRCFETSVVAIYCSVRCDISADFNLIVCVILRIFISSKNAPTNIILSSFYESGIIFWNMTYSPSSSVICQTTGPKPLPKRFLHFLRSRSSSFNWQYPHLSLRSSSNFLCLLPLLLVTSICPFIFPSVTCCRRQFLRKMWPIQLAVDK